ncbi:hypothetical protein WA158_006027 [Blastocystis sp. Blastoise]
MFGSENLPNDDKYLFTFQDESQIWISKDFIKKYPQLPFYDIIIHSEKYEDGSYYIDIPFYPMNKVIQYLMDQNMDIFSLNLRDSYDIYKILIEYSVMIDSVIQSDLLFHVKVLFYNYLKDNYYYVYIICYEHFRQCMPIELFSLEKKKIHVTRFITPQRKDELFYYSLLFKMMNITQVSFEYKYSSNIPLEYICPSCIKDIFPSLKEVKITVNTQYEVAGLLFDPFSNEYKVKHTRLLYDNEYTYIRKRSKYYNESDMNEYNNISSSDLNNLHVSKELTDSYSEKIENSEFHKLYINLVNESMNTKKYLNVETCETDDKYGLNDEISIKYDDKTNDEIFCIDKVYSKHVISQLLCLPSYLSISKIILNENFISQSDSKIFMKLFEEGVFDSLTTLSVKSIKELANEIDDNLYIKIMTTHVFPNVTELIYDYEDDEDDSDDNYDEKDDDDDDDDNDDDDDDDNDDDDDDDDDNDDDDDDNDNDDDDDDNITDNLDSLFPVNLMSIIDTIRINGIDYDVKDEICLYLDNLAYTSSIHIDIIFGHMYDWIESFPHLKELLEKNLITCNELYSYNSLDENIKIFDSIENFKQNIDSINIRLKFYENDLYKRNALERFLKSNALEYLNKLDVLFDKNISMECLTWISTLFNDNKFNALHKLDIDLESIIKDSLSSEYLTAYENILEKLIPKASIVNIENCTMTFINRLIPTGCFHKTTQLILEINDIPDDTFCKLYITDNFSQLKYIKIYQYRNREWWLDFIKILCNNINNNNFPSSSIVRLGQSKYDYCYDYVYDPNTSIFRYKYVTNSFMNTIIGTKNKTMNKFEIETLFDYIFDEEQLSKLINFITTGEFPKLKEFLFVMYYDISDEKITIYKQQLNDSTFIQENHVNYELYKDL